MTIVVAEDDPDDRLLIEDAFSEGEVSGEIHFVEDGEDLLDYLRREGRWSELKGRASPSLILLDLNMPRMDGREALKQIKSHESLRSIPVVVLTTSNAEEDVQSTYACGVNSYISKPGSFDQLVDIIRTLNEYWISTVRLPSIRLH